MPQVPVYGDRQLRTEALRPPTAREADVSSGGRAMGAALMSVGNEVDKIALRESETRANEVDNQITRAWNQWEDENRGKYTNQTADGYRNAVDTWWKEAAKTYGADLDPRAQQMVGRALMRRQTLALDQAGKHEAVEKEKYADSTTGASINTATVNALKSGDYEGEAARIRDLVAMQGARKNWDKAQRDAEVNNRLGTYHTAVATQLAERDAAAAQTYLEAAIQRGEVPPDRQTRLETIIKGEADNQFAAQFAAQNARLPFDEQLKVAGEIADPKRREKTLMQIKNNHALVKEAQRAQEENFADQAWQLVGQGRRVPEAVLAGMDGRARVQLQEHLRAKAERGPAVPKTDPKDHARLVDLMLNDPEAFKQERLIAAKLSPSDLEQFAAKQQALRAGGAKQDSMLSDEARVNAALIGAGIDGKKQPEIATQVRTEIDQRVRAASAEKGGKPLTPDEKQRVVDSVMMDKVFVDEWGRDPQKPLSLLKPDEMKDAYVNVGGKPVKLSSVPATDRAQIIAALKRRGMPVTEQAIAETFLRKNPK